MFETERLILRRLNENDAEEIFKMRSDGEVMRFIRVPQVQRSEAEKWIELISSRWQTEKIGFCALIEKTSGEFLGWCGLWRLVESDEIEVGYALHRKFWGKGFAVEAAKMLLNYGFNDLELDQIVAVARPENNNSRRVMEKIGMSYDYTGRFYERDLVHYSITRKEFLKLEKGKDL